MCLYFRLVIIDKLDKKSGGTEKNIFEHIRHSARYKFVKACLSDKQMIVDVLRTFQVPRLFPVVSQLCNIRFSIIFRESG